jgi:hypothetical protein
MYRRNIVALLHARLVLKASWEAGKNAFSQGICIQSPHVRNTGLSRMLVVVRRYSSMFTGRERESAIEVFASGLKVTDH